MNKIIENFKDFRPSAAQWQELYAHYDSSARWKKGLHGWASAFVPNGNSASFYDGAATAVRWTIALNTLGISEQEASADISEALGATLYVIAGLHRQASSDRTNVAGKFDPDSFEPTEAVWKELYSSADQIGTEDELQKLVATYLPSGLSEDFYAGFVTMLRFAWLVVEQFIGETQDAGQTQVIGHIAAMINAAARAHRSALTSAHKTDLTKSICL